MLIIFFRVFFSFSQTKFFVVFSSLALRAQKSPHGGKTLGQMLGFSHVLPTCKESSKTGLQPRKWQSTGNPWIHHCDTRKGIRPNLRNTKWIQSRGLENIEPSFCPNSTKQQHKLDCFRDVQNMRGVQRILVHFKLTRQATYCTYNVTLKRVRVTIFVVENEYIF